MALVQHLHICRDTQQVDKGQVDCLHSFHRGHVCCFLPSKERKTLGRGCGRLETPAERRETVKRESTIASTRGGPANPSGLPMTTPLRNHHQSLLSVGGVRGVGFGEKISRILNVPLIFGNHTSATSSSLVCLCFYVQCHISYHW